MSSPPAKSPKSPAKSAKSPTKSKSPTQTPAQSPKGKAEDNNVSSPKRELETPSSPQLPTATGDGQTLLPAEHWHNRPLAQVDPDDDTDSALGDDQASSTASLSSSIFAYRQINGRTFHSERGTADYWAANDQKANDTMDMHHHLQLLVSGRRLFNAPIPKDVKKILDVATGTGLWAIDVGDDYPDAEIIGTDVSPIQSVWVPPNVKFEMEDCTQSWTFPDNTFDFVHIRYLCGSIADWEHIFREAYRVCKPGGWIESGECEVHQTSDHTVQPGMAIYDWGLYFVEYGKRIGRTFRAVTDDVQESNMRKVGFEELDSVDFQIPLSGWPKDPHLAEIGRFAYATFCSDLEGFLSLPARELMGWGQTEVQIFCAHVRNEARSRKVHWGLRWKTVWGRKPLGA